MNNFPHNITYPFKPFLDYFFYYFSIKIPQNKYLLERKRSREIVPQGSGTTY